MLTEGESVPFQSPTISQTVHTPLGMMILSPELYPGSAFFRACPEYAAVATMSSSAVMPEK